MFIHRRYQDLCGIAAAGAASRVEFDELVQHLQGCAECRTLLNEMIQAVASVLPELAGAYRRTKYDEQTAEFASGVQNGRPSASVERIARDLGKGQVQSRKPILWSIFGTLTATVLICLVVFAIYLRTHTGSAQQMKAAQPVPVAPIITNRPSAGSSESLPAETTEQLRKMQARIYEVEAKIKMDERAAKAAEAEKTQLLSRIADDDKAILDLRSAREGQDAKTGQLKEQLAGVEAALKGKDVELRALNARLAEIDEDLNRERDLNAAFRQVQEIITARSVHLVSIREIEPSAERKGPVGHIFYTHGKALMYAFNLAGPGAPNAKMSFRVWGEKSGATGPAKSLGVFQSDDERTSRWRFALDDPDVLAKIDAVFVTAEPDRKMVAKPSGKRILFARLVDDSARQ
jgi:hypothetical protein